MRPIFRVGAAWDGFCPLAGVGTGVGRAAAALLVQPKFQALADLDLVKGWQVRHLVRSSVPAAQPSGMD